jgi:uncharacterized delta-60 repeat protein
MRKIGLLFLIVLTSLTGQAQEVWGLDTCFGIGGMVTTGFGAVHDYGLTMLLQADGKIIGTGSSKDNNGTPSFAMVRYNSDGSIDESFGLNGKVTYPNGGAESAMLQPDQKIILSGYSRANSYSLSSDTHELLRFNTDGSLDSTFGVNGRVSTSFGEEFNHTRASVMVLPDGKILQCGTLRHFVSKVTLGRYESNGLVDSTFGVNGSMVMELPDFGVLHPSVRLQGDKILLSGRLSVNNSSTRFMLLRFNYNGDIDTTFGTNGIVTTEVQNVQHIGGQFEVLEDGKILLTGRVDPHPELDYWLLKYNENGTLDSAFGTNGMVSTDFGHDDISSTLVTLSDGKIIVAGWIWEPDNYNGFGIAKYNSDGTLDLGFGAGGKMEIQIGPKNDNCYSGIEQPDGKLLFFGHTDITQNANDVNWDFALVRLSTAGCGIRTNISDPEDEADSFTLFPNPATNSVNINYNWVKSGGKARLRIINSVGQVVFSSQMKSEHMVLDVSEFKSGIYFVNVTVGTNKSNEKLIIQ